MKTIGFLPLRKGSKGILNKNKRKMAGRPLFSWVLTEAIFSDLDKVYVYTDDVFITDYIAANYKWTDKVTVMKRSPESASDKASTEHAINEFCNSIKYDFDVFCLLQATSPFTTAADIDTCLKKQQGAYDSVMTVVKTHRFAWTADGKPMNYDFMNRPRRQDFNGLLIENGAVYTTSKEALKDSKNRISGSIGLVEMEDNAYHEIDSETDWKLVEQLLIDRLIANKKSEAITHIILDVDGVFTNGEVAYTAEGEISKNFDMRDGMGLEVIRELGIKVMIMTSENSALVAARMKKLKIEEVYLGVKDKYSKLRRLISEKNLSAGTIAYVGDDVNDLASMCYVGMSMVPNNGMNVIKRHADIVLNKDGGAGAIREACELVLKHNKRYE